MLKVTVEEMLAMEEKVLLDLRSPSEYEKGTIHGAINIPILSNEEREIVGKIYKQKSPEEAKIEGIHHVSQKLNSLFQQVIAHCHSSPNVILFCSRGGYRSGPFVKLLNSLGIDVFQLEGGYKQYRRFSLDYFQHRINLHTFIVVHGYTGSGKSAVLKRLKAEGFPALLLEQMAMNTGSVFGCVPYSGEKINQKQFESHLLNELLPRENRVMFIESESVRIGSVQIPPALYKQMAEGFHVLIEASVEQRVDQLVSEYCVDDQHFPDKMARALDELVRFLGREKIRQMKELLVKKCYHEVARDLVMHYYDPLYRKAIEKYTYDLKITCDTIDGVFDQLVQYFWNSSNHVC